MHNDIRLLIHRHRVILDILDGANEKSKLVGGCVRDFLLFGVFSNDVDISTTLSPEEVIKKLKDLKKINIQSDLVILDKDKAYGTIIALIGRQRYEITTTRADIACFGRQAKVEFCSDFHTDSNRRDFTINALYVGLNGKILDFHNGIDDLENGVIRFIGEPKQRIEEDFLRIVRLFRFATKFNFFQFDNKTLDALKSLKYGLKNISRERIRSEIFKMLGYDNWYLGLKEMEKYDLIEDIFLVKNGKKGYIGGIDTKSVKNDAIKLCYFFNFNFDILEVLKTTLRFTKSEVKFVDFLMLFFYQTDGLTQLKLDAKISLFHSDKTFVNDVIGVCSNDLREEITKFCNSIKPLPITAQDLIKLDFVGKKLGEKIRQIEKYWIESGFTTSKEEMLRLCV